MIFDSLVNAKQYKGLNAKIDKLLEEAKKYTSDNYPEGVLELDGKDLYMIFANYETHDRKDAVVEAHKQYIDVMYMVEGEETIYVKQTQDIKNITKEYDAEIDALLGDLDDDAVPIRLKAGSFVVLFPQDAHSPACVVDAPLNVKKIIGKVRI
ncbi:MAG: YhcH/YjgK/YiaL family protein [Clostridia bacterium]|nr:YhcH/YjgK/YiaL family protein [Clostridia bacterium]